jgi:alpha-galactosidase
MDDYSFHSTMASSLCMGWIADAADFDFARGKRLLDRYLQVRHLLVGAWYPLLPCSRDPKDWMGSQYHRPDLDEGMLLIFRHAESPYRSVDLTLRGLKAEIVYELASDSTGEKRRLRGDEMLKSVTLTIPARQKSDLIVYRAVKSK